MAKGENFRNGPKIREGYAMIIIESQVQEEHKIIISIRVVAMLLYVSYSLKARMKFNKE